MIQPELLEILVCPETKQPVKLADPAEIAAINRAITDGLFFKSGTRVENELSEALVREDRHVAYAIRDGIPIMLIEEGIDLTTLGWS